ncbi:MAG TPA: hypothetical protein VFP32_02185 [Candidatus Saccharimonadales bacterium]|nr:hypothetical protein [Candidatus Saccharimonadales bacterium]
MRDKLMRGDTIIEVMISMAILGVVLITSFATSRHSLNSGLEASFRDQAGSYAQQQVELIKQLDTKGSLTGNFKLSAFCIKPPTTSGAPTYQAVDSTTNTCTLPVGDPSAGQYTLVDKYSGDCDTASCTYTVTVTWPSNSAGADNSVTLQYKPQNSYRTTTGAFNPPVSNPVTLPPAGYLSLTTDKGDNPTVYSGDSVVLTWTLDTPANNCKGTTDPNGGGGWNGNRDSSGGSYTINPTINRTYTISCYTADGTLLGQASQTVTVNALQPTVNLTATAGQLGLRWNSAGAIPGMSCVRTLESSDPDTWGDNYLCWPTTENLGLQWSSAGAIGGLSCTQIFEGSDPYTWYDNYLCAPKDYGFRWSSSGSIAGMSCTQWLETADPDTWNDNYLCEPTNNTVDLSWTSTNATSCSSSWGGGGTGTTGSDHVYGLTSDTTFTVTCSGDGGTKSASQPVDVGNIASQAACAGPFCSNTPEVIFYDGTNYGGTAWVRTNDCSWVADCSIPNDSISSIRVFNTNLAIYWDISYGGACWEMDGTKEIPNLGSWNNNISSYKIGNFGGC